MSGVEGTGQVPESNVMSIGLTLGIWEGLFRVDRCCSICLTHGREALADGCEDLGRCVGLGMQCRGCMEGWRRYLWADILILSWDWV